MENAITPSRSGYLPHPQSSGLADVLNIILDKGIVIDAFVRVSLVGIELLTIDARIVVASVDTYLRFAEAVQRLELGADSGHKPGLPELVEGISGKTHRRELKTRAKKALAAPARAIAELPAHASRRRGLLGRIRS